MSSPRRQNTKKYGNAADQTTLSLPPAPVAPADPVGHALAGGSVVAGSGAMFDAIAERYDLINRLMTFGIDQRWRRLAVQCLNLPPHAKVLDLATGTGDLALMAARLAPTCTVVGIDPSLGMLAVGLGKVKAAGLAKRVDLRHGDACQLDIPDQFVDGVTMGFGIRNVANRAKALREIARVLRPGARVCILEATEPTGLLGAGARFHLRVVVPRLGALLARAPQYRYLQQSVAAFPQPHRFGEIMESSGLKVLEIRKLLLGVAHLFVATPSGTAPGEAGS
ncbi:MAG: ubiquinone/menaquinone biosynthesis methyltransferase [Deltaproteobacteria bacterium]|nr:ubiquinone/menaquinone biosynthesis methyltransferase [Deltaproteobacteria bacterium]